MSAYKMETWTKKGYTEEEAKYQIAIRRPSNVLYYVHKFGVSLEEAEIMKYNHQQKGGKASATRPIEEMRKSSPRCIEYYLNKNYTTEEAEQALKEVQSYTIEKCIAKYGNEEGIKKWSDRQDKWQNTLKSKPQEEIDDINKKKNIYNIKNWTKKYGLIEGTEKYKSFLKEHKQLFESLDELQNYILSDLNPLDCYLPIEKVKKKIRPYMWSLIDKPKDIEKWLQSFIDFKAPHGNIIFKTKKQNKYGYYQLYVDDKLLRSGNEIYFYQLLCEYGLKHNEDYLIEKVYNNSKLRCDFYLIKHDLYIEIAGQTSEEYIQKMSFKHDTFGSIILWDQKDYKPFLESYYSV